MLGAFSTMLDFCGASCPLSTASCMPPNFCLKKKQVLSGLVRFHPNSLLLPTLSLLPVPLAYPCFRGSTFLRRSEQISGRFALHLSSFSGLPMFHRRYVFFVLNSQSLLRLQFPLPILLHCVNSSWSWFFLRTCPGFPPADSCSPFEP